METKKDRRERIRLRLRKKLAGDAARPRLAVFRSVAHIYVQAIDDASGTTVASASTTEAAVKGRLADGERAGNVKGAAAVGRVLAERLKEKGITRVVFDRGGFLYHGRVRAVAEAAREAGLEF
ncbi:MAG: 50S ribosomal protein L18 [Acidobacteria bacterium]|nr:50S ribosomal protein L18 [Acidobacteriota bacterium]